MKPIRVLRALTVTAVLAHPLAVAGDDFRFRLRGDLFTEYTDNLFHYSDDRLDGFDALAGPGERFAGLESESDVVTRARVRTDYRWKLAKKRHFTLLLNGRWYRHLENDIADYGELRAGGELDLTRRDHLALTVDRTLDRFKKNYRLANTLRFDEASYDQTDVALGYTRDLGDKGRGEFGAELTSRRRRYNEEFDSRDLDGDYLSLRTAYPMGKSVKGETAVQVGDVESGTEIDIGVLIDRSYDQYRVDQSFGFKVGRRTRLTLELRLRRRDYTTGEADDTGRFEREDDYARVRATLEKKWKSGLAVWVRGAVVDNDSDRIDPTVETDETGYEEVTAAVGLGYEF